MHEQWMVSIILGSTHVSAWQYTKEDAQQWISKQMAYAAKNHCAVRSPKIIRMMKSDMRDTQIINGLVWTWHNE